MSRCSSSDSIPYFVFTEASGNDIKLLQERVQHLESINQKITCDLEQMYAADKEKARQLEDVLEEKEKVNDG